MSYLEQEPEVQQALQVLIAQLSQHEMIQGFQKIQNKARQNKHLKELEATIKRVQKDAVQYAHYQKPEAEQQAILQLNQLNKEYAEHPLVVAYREKLLEADELLHYLTNYLQRQMNLAIEEEEENASKNETNANDGTIF